MSAMPILTPTERREYELDTARELLRCAVCVLRTRDHEAAVEFMASAGRLLARAGVADVAEHVAALHRRLLTRRGAA